jgi:hypothetical protein
VFDLLNAYTEERLAQCCFALHRDSGSKCPVLAALRLNALDPLAAIRHGRKQSFSNCSNAAVQRPVIRALIVEVKVAAHWEACAPKARNLALTSHQEWGISVVVLSTGLSCRNRLNAWTALCSLSP